jgi:polyisoprenoid-binding protein YceI
MVLVCFCFKISKGQKIYELENSKVEFHSEAPQELISASSTEMKGAIDIARKSFAFKIGILSFMGFNSPLQRDHFNENYMESNTFPEASFSGKIIEDIDLSVDGVHSVRAKGKLRIHGIEKERIIKAQVTVKGQMIYVSSNFMVALSDHNIRIPRIVSEKLAQDISVSVKANLRPR